MKVENKTPGASILRHLRILKCIFKTSFIADLQYRSNLVLKMVADFVWYAAQISIFEVLFSHTKSLSGWSIDQTRIFLGYLFVVDALYCLFFQENLNRLSDRVRKGDLDLVLAKPMHSQFALSLYKVDSVYLINAIVSAAWLTFTIYKYPSPIPLTKALTLILFLPASVSIVYSLRFFFSTLAIILVRAENIMLLWYQLYRLGTRPDAIFPSWLRYTILFALPLGVIASVPMRSLLFEESGLWLLWSLVAASLCLFLSNRFWQFALRRYSSASS